MITKIMFVLVMITNTGETTHWAQFDTAEECERYARGIRPAMPTAQVACMPLNVKTQAEQQQDIKQALDVATGMLQSMRKQMDEFSKNN